MISALPDDLLVSIVSLMPLKEAAATSVLSTRWRHIWTFVTTLDFQHDILFQLRSYKRVRIESELDSCCLKYLKALDFRSVTGLMGHVLERFLSHCPLLERLTVVRALRMDTFRVIGPSFELERTISEYYEILMEPWRHKREVEIKQAPKYSHHFLRVVEVAEYHGRIGDLKLVRYVIENAVELKELVAHPVREWYSRENIMFNMGNRDGVKRKEKLVRKQAIQKLRELVPSTVELICRLEQPLSLSATAIESVKRPMGLLFSRDLSSHLPLSRIWNCQEYYST
ncbi:putative F-box/FBD/LRR-repeat protein At3g49040 [Argentina anserina]|uniref:putative F-box/FBD/LRR-repeat protein At3g49040 n=1 Tax=Argentina anserina TaxID=57926 RepID=UPI0021764C70|nr:putative F-box/FBD/LRR-repeat protein At3g49040 [Potentilla anserina]